MSGSAYETTMRCATNTERRVTTGDYLFPNSDPETVVRFAALSELFDDVSIHHLKRLAVGVGWHCLEVGAGAGSIAKWLAGCVGPSGRVLATDIDPCFLKCMKSPNIEIRQHDIVTDALPETSFDLVHSRLVLHHIPQREQALERLISALKPGGWILLEDHDSVSMPPDPATSAGEILLKTQLAAWKVLDDGGVNRSYGRLLFGRLRAYGLTDVGAEARAFMWQSGSAGAAILRANFQQLRAAMISRGYVTPQEFEDDLSRLDQPEFVAPSGILWSCWGRKQ
jgi:SAM-dependent methyltransferase